MSFDGVSAQHGVARALRGLLRSGRLPHALLFAGSPGTGRLAMARELAAVALCTSRTEPDSACAACRSCELFRRGAHPDYHEQALPGGRQSLSIDAVRRLQHEASLKPVVAGRRVFVVRDAEKLSLEAANCFLKTLEEPPGGALFVLIASSPRTLPETVLSRCRTLRFRNLPADELSRQLVALGVQEADAHWLARRSWGSPGLAERLRELKLHQFNRKMLEQLAGMSLEDNFRLSDWLLELAREGRAGGPESRTALQEMLECLALYYRDLAVAAAVGRGDADLCNRHAEEAILARAEGAEPEHFVEQAQLVLETMADIGNNANRRLALDCLFTRLGRLNRAS